MLNLFLFYFLSSSVVLIKSLSSVVASNIFLVVSWLLFLSHFSSSLISMLSHEWLFQDEVALFMVFLTVSVLMFSLCFGSGISNNSMLYFVYSIMFVCCLMVFSSCSTFLVYFFYELALLPILYAIIMWGTYTDRVLGSLMLFFYTAVFTLPFLWTIFLMNFSFMSWGLLFGGSVGVKDFFICFLVSLAFCVKLPVYGMHLWLPMAHVEAPTSGSMILAGVLLKLGGVGLLRFSLLVDFSSVNFFLSYLLISLVYVTVVCSFQSDFKRMVAYSSVSHMMMIPILVLSNNILSFKCAILVMLFHGLSSPIMFMIVSILYNAFKTRQILLMKSLILINPLMSFCMALSFFFTVSAPPFPSFSAEALSFISCYTLTSLTMVFFGLYAFLSMIYNLVWLVTIMVNSSGSGKPVSINSSNILHFFSFMPLALGLLLGVAFILLFPFV